MDNKPHRKPSRPSPSRSKRTPITLRGRPHSTRQVTGWFGVDVEEVRRWVHEKAYFSHGRYSVVLDQMVEVHRRGRRGASTCASGAMGRVVRRMPTADCHPR